MTEYEFWQKKQQLDMLMGQGNRFAQAAGICQELWEYVCTACAGREDFGRNNDVPSLRVEMAQIYAAIIIETGDLAHVQSALERLSLAGENPYSRFLQARIFWMQRRYFAALALLENSFQVGTEGGQVAFAKDSSYWQVNEDVQERVLNLLAKCYKFYGLTDLAADCYLRSSNVVKHFPSKVLEYSNYLFNTHYLFMPKEEYFLAHTGFNNLFKGIKKYKHKSFVHKRHRKIRLGYISPDFRHHVVLLFIWAMLTKYDREQFEVYCFSYSQFEDKYSAYIKSQATAWFNISDLNFAQAAKLIYEQEIDILVELAGHSQNNCLPVLAYKPAPVQVCGIGYFATTGLRTVDYFLTDRYLMQEAARTLETQADVVQLQASRYFVEKLLVLPHSHFCYKPLQEMPEPMPAPCREKGYVTFGSFNNLSKVNDTVLAVWAEILRCVPGSRLFLKGDLLSDEEGREIVRQKLVSLGIEEARLELRGFSRSYLTEYYEMDVALDTFPYPGGGTTCDALYMGVPVISLGDGSHGGNFGISLLKNAGLDFCCAYSLEEYVEKAVLLAGDFELLEALHLGLRNMMKASPVMDEGLYMHELESGYRKIWDKYLRG